MKFVQLHVFYMHLNFRFDNFFSCLKARIFYAIYMPKYVQLYHFKLSPISFPFELYYTSIPPMLVSQSLFLVSCHFYVLQKDSYAQIIFRNYPSSLFPCSPKTFIVLFFLSLTHSISQLFHFSFQFSRLYTSLIFSITFCFCPWSLLLLQIFFLFSFHLVFALWKNYFVISNSILFFKLYSSFTASNHCLFFVFSSTVHVGVFLFPVFPHFKHIISISKYFFHPHTSISYIIIPLITLLNDIVLVWWLPSLEHSFLSTPHWFPSPYFLFHHLCYWTCYCFFSRLLLSISTFSPFLSLLHLTASSIPHLFLSFWKPSLFTYIPSSFLLFMYFFNLLHIYFISVFDSTNITPRNLSLIASIKLLWKSIFIIQAILGLSYLVPVTH